MQQKEISRIIDSLERVFEGAAWHGHSVMDVLEDINYTVAFAPSDKIHCICELVQHMTAWRLFAIRKLQGDPVYEVSTRENWKQFEKRDAAAWREILEDLKSSQTELIDALKMMDDEHLEDEVDKKAYSYYTLVHGVIHHDLYHLGEIALLARLNQDQ